MPRITFEHRRRETTAKLAALMLANAFIFQEQLSTLHQKVRPIRSLLTKRDFLSETAAHWQMIVTEIDYVPIFTVSRDILLSIPAGPDTDASIRKLATRALDIVSNKAALRHDLMGRIYHLLLLEAKYLGTYYTSVPAATLLLKLALDIDHWPDQDWADPDALKKFQIADLACGTGTLLMAANQALTDNFIKFRVSRGESVTDGALKDLHKLSVEEMLHGYDVLPSAVHLTASTLALLAPDTCFNKMRLYSLPLGKKQSGQIYLGSIDYISADMIRTQLDLMSPTVGAENVDTARQGSVAPLPTLDLCVMNPPFVRSVGGNLLFGSIPDDRKQMQGELARRLRESRLPASSTAGLGSIFAAIGDRHIRPGGRLALVLPAAVLTGIAWERTRDLINYGYVLETVVASHDPARWNFSENTDLSEVLLIARKRDRRAETDTPRKTATSDSTQFINLWRNPANSAYALAVAQQVTAGAPAPIGEAHTPSHGISEITIGSWKYGETVEIPWDNVRTGPWIGCAFAQTNLIRAAWFLRGGQLYYPGRKRSVPIPTQRLGDIARLGPDRRDIADGFTVSESATDYPALMGHRAENTRAIELEPNKWLAPRFRAATGRPLRDVALLWARAGRIMIAERSRLNTQRTLAVRLSDLSLSNVWWPVRLKEDDREIEKVLTLWLNSSVGLLTLIAHRIPTEGAWIQFKKPTIENLPILRLSALSREQIKQIASAYDTIAKAELGTIADVAIDPTRASIDRVFCRTLGLPSLDWLRVALAEEPIISLRTCGGDEPAPVASEPMQFELL